MRTRRICTVLAVGLLAPVLALGAPAAVATPAAVAAASGPNLAFGPGCVRPAEFVEARRLGEGTRRTRIHRVFGAKGAPALDMYGVKGALRVYYACPPARWDRRWGDGPKYWIVVAKYRDGRLARLFATNRGYRP